MTAGYQARFESFAANGGGSPAWVLPLRRRAMDRFAATGFPTARDEEWRFTPIAPITQREFAPAPGSARVSADDLVPFEFGHSEWPRLVFVNGRFAEGLSQGLDGAGVRIGSLAAALAEDPTLERHLGRYALPETTPFSALNTAFLQDGALVQVPAGVVPDRPVHVLFVTTAEADGAIIQPRNLFVVERGARASIVEQYVTLAPAAAPFTNAVTEVFSAEGAWTEHTRIQREGPAAYHVGLTSVNQARDSHYRSFTLAMGAAISRHNLHVCLGAPNVETLMYGLYLGEGEQLVDNHTAIFHDHPGCRSWEVYKGILGGRSRAVFNGKVFVKPEAQKTDAKQTNRNLLLSDSARVDTKPQLEIFADDVKCTHGATVGSLDEVGLFYARSRGIPLARARELLTYAFAAEVVAEVKVEPVREELDRLVRERLAAGA